MSYDAREWWNGLTIRRGIRLDVPGCHVIRGPLPYVVYSSSDDPEYRRHCADAMSRDNDREGRVREKLRAKRAAALFTEMWERRLAGESLEDIGQSEGAA